VRKAQQEVEDGLAKFIQSRDQVVFLTRSVEAALGALRIGLLEYKEGTADFTVVLNAEQNLYQAQNNLAVARGNVPLGLIAAYRALGGGWQLREDRDFVPDATRAEMAQRTNWGTFLTPDLLRPDAPGLPSPEDRGRLVRPPEWGEGGEPAMAACGRCSGRVRGSRAGRGMQAGQRSGGAAAGGDGCQASGPERGRLPRLHGQHGRHQLGHGGGTRGRISRKDPLHGRCAGQE